MIRMSLQPELDWQILEAQIRAQQSGERFQRSRKALHVQFCRRAAP
jgi:hypothetical protein